MPHAGQLVRKDNPNIRIVAVVETLPGLAWVSGASVLESGVLELEYGDQTKVDWNGQRPVLGPDGRIFVDENDAFVPETEVVVFAADEGELYPPRLPVACRLKPAASMMDALQHAVAGRRVRLREWEADVYLRFSPSIGFALGRFSDPTFAEPYSPARLDVDAATWSILSEEEVGRGA